MFKSLLLGVWNGLRDRELSRNLGFRYDFRRFTGLPFETDVPDDTTFCVFRKRILSRWNRLLEIVNKQIKNAGYEVHAAVSVNATLVEAHTKPQKDDDDEPEGGDPDASWRGFPVKTKLDERGKEVLSRRMALYGYKVNLAATVGTGFISRFFLCKASEHETHHMMRLLKKETKAVYADKGYVGNREGLRSRGILDGIRAKATRSHALRKKDVERYERITKKRRIVEGVFVSLKQWYGWRKTKFLGLERNCLAMAIMAVAWNLKKWMRLEAQAV
jgi:IS5 family transposase